LSAPALFDARGDLGAVPVHPHQSADPDGVLRRLGPPPGFDSVAELVDTIGRAATRAWRLAQDTNDDPLLAALRQLGSATAAELATELAMPPGEIRRALRPLLTEGLVYRTGHARSTRYHA